MEIIPNKREKNMLVDGSRITGFSSSGLSDFIDVGTQNLEELQLILKQCPVCLEQKKPPVH